MFSGIICGWINSIVCVVGEYTIGVAMERWGARRSVVTGQSHDIMGPGIGLIIGLIVSAILVGLVVAILRLRNEEKSENEDAVETLPSGARQQIIVPDGVITQAKCKNCLMLLSCEKFCDENSCCENHVFFRG